MSVRNDGTAALGITRVGVTGKGFTLAANRCPTSLAAAKTCSIVVEFTARRPFGVKTGALSILSTDQNEGTSTVALRGTVVKGG